MHMLHIKYIDIPDMLYIHIIKYYSKLDIETIFATISFPSLLYYPPILLINLL